MAEQGRKKDGPGKKRPLLEKYFFLDGDLHCKLYINRGRDFLVAWNYPKGKKVSYSYSTVIHMHKRAYSTAQVSKMLNRSKETISRAIVADAVKEPQYTYGLDENRNVYKHMWKEEEIMDLLDYFSSVHQGRPRLDGKITNWNLPTPREVRALLNDAEILYVKQGEDYVPVWKAKEF